MPVAGVDGHSGHSSVGGQEGAGLPVRGDRHPLVGQRVVAQLRGGRGRGQVPPVRLRRGPRRPARRSRSARGRRPACLRALHSSLPLCAGTVTTSSPTLSSSTRRASAANPSSVTSTSAASSGTIDADADRAPLGVVGQHHEPVRGGHERPVRVRLHQIGRGEPGPFADPVHAEEQHVEVERGDRGHGERADERVGRRAYPAGEHHRLVGPAADVQGLGDRDRVGDHRQAGHVDQSPGQLGGGGAGGERDGGAGPDELRGVLGDRRLLGATGGRTWRRSRAPRSSRDRRGWRRRGPWRPGPRSASASRSRRMVMSDTPNSATSSVTRTPPARRTRSRIAVCRCCASIPGPPPSVTDRDAHAVERVPTKANTTAQRGAMRNRRRP